MTQEKETSKKATDSDSYQLVNVATQHTPAIQSPGGEIMGIEECMVEMLNRLEKIEKVLG